MTETKARFPTDSYLQGNLVSQKSVSSEDYPVRRVFLNAFSQIGLG